MKTKTLKVLKTLRVYNFIKLPPIILKHLYGSITMSKKKRNVPDKTSEAREPQPAYGKRIVFFNSFEEENEYTHRYYASLTPEESLAQVTGMRLLRNLDLNENINPWGNKIYMD